MAAIAAGELGEHPRARSARWTPPPSTRRTAHFDLAVFALSFHHLPPALAARVFAEGTRVADKLLIIDLPRPPAPLHLLRLATMLPLAPFVPFVHDGVISSLRTLQPVGAARAGRARRPGDRRRIARRPCSVRRWWWHAADRLALVGEEVTQTEYSRAHRREYRRKVQLCLDVFETMLAQSSFEFDRPLTGMEIECNLVDADYQPAMTNREVLASIADPAYQTELGAYNIEFNVPPRPLPGRSGARAGGRGARQPERRRGEGQRERRAHRDDRHPADADARTPVRPTG